jgi:hypothetical protein
VRTLSVPFVPLRASVSSDDRSKFNSTDFGVYDDARYGRARTG